jgi:hypothetical protein
VLDIFALALVIAFGLSPLVLAFAATQLWPSPHVCPDPVRGEATSYRAHAWRTASCSTCIWSHARRVGSVSLGLLAAAAFVGVWGLLFLGAPCGAGARLPPPCETDLKR